uniref:Uncharacterized protein n=1 Tax=Amorphochlora amoebiformis TaxID=1561963 RepID=A0A7S0DKG9_9EUKA|mmetsp:Transcript_32167/g.51806  ORF Transcript_32167/g.51806 Transcript_32167/m.51806 type:complete len:189 (+) Transcript_32167:48-614(+)
MYHSHLWELVGRDLLNLRTFAATPVAIIRYFVSAIKSRSIVLVAFVAAAFQYIATATAMRLEHKIKNDKQSPTFMQIARNGILTGTSVLSLLLVQSLFVILLDDRNTFLAKNILKECARSQPGDVVVAVLGLAHCPGVRQLLLACQVQGHPPCSASRRLRKGLSTCCKGTKRGSRSSRTKGLDCWGMS